MKKLLLFTIGIGLTLGLFLYSLPLILHPLQADEIEELQKQIDELGKAKDLSVAATKPLEGQVQSLRNQLAQIQNNLTALSNKIKDKEKDIKVREDKLAYQQVLLEERVRSYYIRSYMNSPLRIIFSSGSSGGLFRDISYQQAATKQDQRIITSITQEMVDIVNQKQKLEKDKTSLASLQGQVDSNAKFLDGEIKKAKDYQTNLSSQIAQLSAKQQAILSAKSGTFTTSVGDVPLADDPNAAPNYNPGFSPAFAAFSFGAYTHGKGMSQYGARGRADSGQNFKEILKAYYGKEPTGKETGGSIKVTGLGDIDFETTYLYGIAEMPASWHKEALKAQAVAARSYAYRYKADGKEICATESCQVFLKSKSDNAPQAWKDAVNETKGQVIEDVVTYYSSTTGGYVTPLGWDTKCGSKDCWTADAYEKLAGSPWFYKGWYKDRSGASCGRSHPWLTQEEMSDILNSWIVYQSGSDQDRISPTNTSCWPGNPFSMDEMRSKAGNNGGAVTSISGTSVSYSTNGSTASVNFSTNRGTINIAGSDFKTIFNLRAPGYISIKSALFNIEKK